MFGFCSTVTQCSEKFVKTVKTIVETFSYDVVPSVYKVACTFKGLGADPSAADTFSGLFVQMNAKEGHIHF